MDPIGAISLVSLLLIIAMCAGMLVRRLVYEKELAELKKNAEEKKQQPVPSDDQAARDYATFALRNRIGIPPDEAFKDGIAYERERVAAYIRECLEPVQQYVDNWDAFGSPRTSSYHYNRGKVQGYKDILRDLESGGLDEYMSEKGKEE